MRNLVSQQTAAGKVTDRRAARRRWRSWTLSLLATTTAVLAATLSFSSTPALAAGAGPGWAIQSRPLPSSFAKADAEACSEMVPCDAYDIWVTNVGDGASNGESVIVRDRLPRGVVLANNFGEFGGVSPEGAEGGINCTASLGSSSFSCEFSGAAIQPGGGFSVGVEVTTNSEVGPEVLNVAEVQGGGAPPAVTASPSTEPNPVFPGVAPPTEFGVQDFSVGAFGEAGAPDLQAGDHPRSISTAIGYSTVLAKDASKDGNFTWPAVAEPKTQIVDLPLGLVGDPLAAPECTQAELWKVQLHPQKCPAGSQVGIVTVDGGGVGVAGKNLYNIVPEPGYPAEFGFEFDNTLFYLRARVLPSPEGYVLSITVPDIGRASAFKVTGAVVTLFGDPQQVDGVGAGEAFLTNPDACGSGVLSARMEMDSWVQPARWVKASSPVFGGLGQGVTGCGALSFEPSVEVKPEESTVDSPSGYEVDLKVPQSRNAPGLLATPDLKNAVVSFPAGVSVSPSAADGLKACRETGPEGINITHGWEPTGAQPLDPADPEAMEIQEDELPHVAPGHCPAASQIGEAEVITPVLPGPLKGHVFVAEPECGGEGQAACTPADAADGRLFGIFLELSGSGVIVKLKGKVSVNPQTGQLTTSFLENPQLPFSELKLHLNGGPRAPLANPQSCGTFTATSDLTPWSTPVTADATPFSSFQIGGCPATTPFAPSFLAETTNPQAGAFSPFTLTFSRHDGEQDLSGLTVSMPQGLIGRIAGIAQCGEAEVKAAEANNGGCPAASKVGAATAAAGAGSHPFWQSGSVYLTGPYNGAPFGLSVVVPANAGPFHLGNIVVRAAIHINPETAAVTVVSNPLPQMIDGVPLRVQTVNVTVGGEGTPFTFNPTHCAQQAVSGTISSAQGATANVSTPFAASGCATLPFKPSFSVSAQGHTSKANGASLDVRIATRQGPGQPAGVQEANIRKVDVQLPKDLPSRLSTLQKACTEHQFAVNPAGCPEGSFVGTAVAVTPLLPVPLEGPAILVSHGGAAFPDLDLMLQGDGVTIDLTGNTEITKGITYSKFETAPDAPFSSFELKLPEGPHSVLGAYIPSGGYDFCGLTKTVTVSKKETKRVKGKLKKVTVKVKSTVPASLEMPTSITAQNGATVTQNTKIALTGCPKPPAAKKAAAKKASASKARRTSKTARRG